MTQPLHPPELVIWDFDGTIADTHAVITNTFAQVFAERDLGTCDTAVLTRLIGLPLRDAFAHITGNADPAFVADLVDDYRRIFAVRAPWEATMFDGIDQVLAGCAARGLPCAITTSRGRTSLDDMLDRFGIAAHFTVVVTDDDVINPKPHPEMVERVGAATGIDPACSLLIGDATYDIEMGRRAGTRTCAVTWGNQSFDELAVARPDHVVDRPDELVALLET